MRAMSVVLAVVAALAAAAMPPTWIRLDSVCAAAVPQAGVWRMMPRGAVFSVDPVAGRHGTFELTMLYCERFDITPGTVFGTMTQTASEGVYEASLAIDPSGRKPDGRRRSFTVEMPAPYNRLVFKPYKSSWSVNFYRLLPYLFRFSVRHDDTRPSGLDGAVRIAPDNADGIVIL